MGKRAPNQSGQVEIQFPRNAWIANFSDTSSRSTTNAHTIVVAANTEVKGSI